MDVKKCLVSLPLAAVLALTPAYSASAAPKKDKPTKSRADTRDTKSQATARGAGRKVH